MNKIVYDNMKKLSERFEELAEELALPEVLAKPQVIAKITKERSTLEPKVNAFKAYCELIRQYDDSSVLVESESDSDLVKLAREEMDYLSGKISELEEDMKFMILPPDPMDGKDIIMEIRAGTGGEEAALFAGDLYKMYFHYADTKGWKVESISSTPSEKKGFKEIIFSINGSDVYSRLKYESGVHRVQRVPETEASGRIHTSAASVVVLPEAEDVNVEINPGDLKVDVYRSSGPGGQSVNTTDSAVRITHIPTGMVVTCQDEKSQLKNKNKAMKVLRARLNDRILEEQTNARSATRRSMVSTGDRSAKIRTYNYPQNRLTDHRINLTLYKLDEILAGSLDEMVESLRLEDRKKALEEHSAELSS